MTEPQALCAQMLPHQDEDGHCPPSLWDPTNLCSDRQLFRWQQAIELCFQCPLLGPCERALAADPARYGNHPMVVAGMLINRDVIACNHCRRLMLRTGAQSKVPGLVHEAAKRLCRSCYHKLNHAKKKKPE